MTQAAREAVAEELGARVAAFATPETLLETRRRARYAAFQEWRRRGWYVQPKTVRYGNGVTRHASGASRARR